MLVAGMALTLFGFWLILSGHYTPLLIVLGAVSSIAVAAFAMRLRIVDSEGFPVRLLPAMATYWVWLLGQIVKSAIGVARLVVDPRLPISPTWIRVTASQDSAPGIATYANSITLTPGTVSVDIAGRDLLVHAIERTGADDLAAGEMDGRITRAEGLGA